jgi:hypothetical protein
MSNPNFKGRKKGSIKQVTSIIDPLLGDYKILIDSNCYNLVYINPETKNEQNIGYYTQLNNALKRIVKEQTIKKKETYSLQEYLLELENTLNNLKQLTDHE